MVLPIFVSYNKQFSNIIVSYNKQFLTLNKTDTSVLYVSLDHIWFTEHKLYDLAENFVKRGGKHLFLDEVHKYQGGRRN